MQTIWKHLVGLAVLLAVIASAEGDASAQSVELSVRSRQIFADVPFVLQVSANDFDEAPYQIQQSLTTLGVGGGSGVGLGRGAQKLSFLPEANTDFLFAVVGEELGIIGTLGLIALWVFLCVSFCVEV